MFERNADAANQVEAMRSLMEGIVHALVDSQESVVVKAISSVSGTSLVITAAPNDIGKIIGKQGRTAMSLRTVLGAASVKMGHSFFLDVQEERFF